MEESAHLRCIAASTVLKRCREAWRRAGTVRTVLAADAMTKEAKKHVNEREVRRDEFMKDPGRVVERAKVEGPVRITDREGRARLLICIPTDERPEPIR
jgi:hypothetical protein